MLVHNVTKTRATDSQQHTIISSRSPPPEAENHGPFRYGHMLRQYHSKQENMISTKERKMSLCRALILVAPFLSAVGAFHGVNPSCRPASWTTTTTLTSHSPTTTESDRRSFLLTAGHLGLLGALLPVENAWAGIDVSGLQTEGGGSGNSALASQLKAFDGSGSTRIKEVKAIQSSSTDAVKTVTKSIDLDPQEPVATWAYRANPGFNPSLSRTGPFGNLYRLNDMVQAPSGSKRRSIGIQFEFPNDWLQLDRNIGGIQCVDQRNGDKLYVFRAPLPADTTLENLPKASLGDYIFDPKGSFAKSGQTIEEYKVASAQVLSVCPNQMCATRRRFKIKYATVTGNGLRVERRALVDAYQIDNDIYMLMTSSNAIKFDQKDSLERETVESIVNSFQIDV